MARVDAMKFGNPERGDGLVKNSRPGENSVKLDDTESAAAVLPKKDSCAKAKGRCQQHGTYPDTTMPPEILADELSALALTSSQGAGRDPDRYCGSDIPRKTTMLVKRTGRTQSDYSVQFLAPGLTVPYIEIAVKKRTFTKTVAVLRQRDFDELVVSVSGWSETFSSTHEYLIDNEHWTKEVFNVCEKIGHRLQPDKFRDKGVVGRYHACHAEKQLLAYVFYRLRKTVTLYISSPPCPDCQRFMSAFVAFTGTRVEVYYTDGTKTLKLTKF